MSFGTDVISQVSHIGIWKRLAREPWLLLVEVEAGAWTGRKEPDPSSTVPRYVLSHSVLEQVHIFFITSVGASSTIRTAGSGGAPM